MVSWNLDTSWITEGESYYKQGINYLIENLGRNVEIYYQQTISNPSSEFLDPLRPGSFRKPRHKDPAVVTTDNKDEIKALIKFDLNDKDIADFGRFILGDKTVCRLKTYLRHMDKLRRADYIIVNKEIKGVFGTKFRLVKGPTPFGFDEDAYCISFWEAI